VTTAMSHHDAVAFRTPLVFEHGIDSSALSSLASVDIAILVGLLVFATILQLIGRRNAASFSIEAAEAWSRWRTVLWLLEVLVYVSAASLCASLLGMTIVDAVAVRLAALVLGLVGVIIFALVSVLSIRWFWRRERGTDA
jgi:hypothetical protein